VPINHVALPRFLRALQIDNTYNKLQTLCEYIDDTEVRSWRAADSCFC
jgi:hypothetical protein